MNVPFWYTWSTAVVLMTWIRVLVWEPTTGTFVVLHDSERLTELAPAGDAESSSEPMTPTGTSATAATTAPSFLRIPVPPHPDPTTRSEPRTHGPDLPRMFENSGGVSGE